VPDFPNPHEISDNEDPNFEQDISETYDDLNQIPELGSPLPQAAEPSAFADKIDNVGPQGFHNPIAHAHAE
jgi:hypothetical protein